MKSIPHLHFLLGVKVHKSLMFRIYIGTHDHDYVGLSYIKDNGIELIVYHKVYHTHVRFFNGINGIEIRISYHLNESIHNEHHAPEDKTLSLLPHYINFPL